MRMNATRVASADDIGTVEQPAKAKKPTRASKRAPVGPSKLDAAWGLVVTAFSEYQEADGELLRLQEDLSQAEVNRDLAFQRLASAITTAGESIAESECQADDSSEVEPSDVPVTTWRNAPLDTGCVAIPASTCKAFAAVGITTLGGLADWINGGKTLLEIKGITEKRAVKVADGWNRYRELSSVDVSGDMPEITFLPPPGTTGTTVPAGIATNDPSAESHVPQVLAHPLSVTKSLFGLADPEPAGGWLTNCPAHTEEGKPSLSVKSSGRMAILKCHAGCSREAISQAVLALEDKLVAAEATKANERPRHAGPDIESELATAGIATAAAITGENQAAGEVSNYQEPAGWDDI